MYSGSCMLVHEPAPYFTRTGVCRSVLSLPGMFEDTEMRAALLIATALSFATGASAEPTYSRDVSRFMQVKCQRCHRPNDIAPFSLTNYAEVQEFIHDVEHAVEGRHMPPW